MKILKLLLVLSVFTPGLFGQETRSMLFGQVYDPQGLAVVGAKVQVRNTETGVTCPTRTHG